MYTGSKLGFGCVKLTSNFTQRGALKNLSTAYEYGITHFDTARLYGFGLSEDILGSFIKDKRQNVSVTTKFGIFPKKSILQNLCIQNSVRYAYKKASFIRIKAIEHADTVRTIGNFNVEDARKSLDISLKKLNTDYIDYFLLHEAIIDDTLCEDLIAFLVLQKQKGKILEFGIGSYYDTIKKDINSLPIDYSVIQTDLSFPGNDLQEECLNKSMFYFSPFRYMGLVKNNLLINKDLCKKISEIFELDILKNLPYLFLLYHKVNKVKGTTLFTSSDNLKIIDTINVWNSIKVENIEVENNMKKKIKSALYLLENEINQVN